MLKSLCTGKINIFWGQSGVGKSSLLNKIFPHLDLETGLVSSSTDKGLHTTVTSVLLNVDKDTFVIDTPGIREIDPFGIRKEDLGHYFVEFGKFASDCKFNTCTHNHEPECKVVEAVENDQITSERYESYLRILETIEEDIIF
jgi:ribosome biogenesis GTPase